MGNQGAVEWNKLTLGRSTGPRLPVNWPHIYSSIILKVKPIGKIIYLNLFLKLLIYIGLDLF